MKIRASEVFHQLENISRLTIANKKSGNRYTFTMCHLQSLTPCIVLMYDGHSIARLYSGGVILQLTDTRGDLYQPAKVLDWCWRRLARGDMPDYIQFSGTRARFSKKVLANFQ